MKQLCYIKQICISLCYSINRLTKKFIEEYGLLWLGLIVGQLVVYTYLFTSVIFTNHTFPNVWLYDYPSFKTLGEGRWLADLIILMQGSSGVQSLQMALAVAMQALNGILFVFFIGVTGRTRIALLAGIICFYPAFLDYYAFSIDHLTFVLGDTLALFGAIFLLKSIKNISWAGVSTLLFLLSIATYGPKIALVSFLASASLLLSLAYHQVEDKYNTLWQRVFYPALLVTGVLTLSILMFWITTRLTISFDIGQRAHINNPKEMLSEVLRSFSWIQDYFINPGGLPQYLKLVPIMLIMIGIIAISRHVFLKHGIIILFFCIIILMIQPILLRLAYIINSNTWVNSGRIITANGYALVFFMALGIKINWSRWITIPLASISLYFYVVLASQENNAAAYKTMYDLNFLNRIAQRVELVIDSAQYTSHALVVVGDYPNFDHNRYVKYPDLRAKSQFQTNSFAKYRQTQIMNFYLGRSIFRWPTTDEVNRAISVIDGRSSWPANESVFLIDDIVVILLQPYRKGIATTNTK